MKVYIVRFSCGRYSDYYDKPVSAWLDIDQAKAEKAVLNEKLDNAYKVFKYYLDVEKYNYGDAEKKAKEVLPDFEYSQHDYFIEETELYGVEK